MLNNDKNINKIIDYYEDFSTYKGEILGMEKGEVFVAPSSIHSDVTTFAYGKALSRQCVDISNGEPLSVKVFLAQEDIKTRRFYIKLTACLRDWTKYENDLKITLNGVTLYKNKQTFFENVNLGWCSQYFVCPAQTLRAGENEIVLQTKNTSGGGLLVSVVDLISLPAFEKKGQISCLRHVRLGASYTVALNGAPWQAVQIENGEIEEIKQGDITLVKLKATHLGKARCVCESDGKQVELILPECVAGEDICLIGTDSDDHRHDDSLETDWIENHFLMSGMGNYYQFRPQYQRNYTRFSATETWEKRVEKLKDFHITVGLSDCNKVMGFIEDQAGENYLGKHIHEPYLFFYRGLQAFPEEQKKYFIDGDILDKSQSYGESKRAYLTALDKTYKHNAKDFKGLSSVGSPSLLCVYEANKFDRVTIEPVSCIPLLVGAVRGTTGNGFWGSHVPVDWYFGAPNDEVKSRKFLLAMQYLYISGAKYIYVESGLYKTNAFSREDWESEFCKTNRKYLRDFYDYTIQNPRAGEIKTDLAVVYGNNEYFMWQSDERIAELPENDDWDQKMWGKWTDNRSQKYWRAIDSWLPPSDSQNTINDALNLRLFTGTPYGSVDIIPYESEYSRYKTVAFLGWNTYENGLAEKLLKFVQSGGTLFISYCHLNTTDRPDKPFVYAQDEIFEKLFGCQFDGLIETQGDILFDNDESVRIEKQTIVQCKDIQAKIIAEDENGNVLVLKNSVGKGKVYFSTIAEYTGDNGVVRVMQTVMDRMGKESAEIYCDNKNIAFTQRKLPDGTSVLHLLNTSCAKIQPITFNLTVNGKIEKYTLLPCEIKSIKIAGDK